MKVIDLLNKIANGEEIPKKFIWGNKEYYLQSAKCYRCDKTSTIFEEDFVFEELNDEVEILEEKEIPKKLETYKEVDEEDYFANILKVSVNGECEIDEATSVIVDKINEIIDYLKSKGE